MRTGLAVGAARCYTCKRRHFWGACAHIHMSECVEALTARPTTSAPTHGKCLATPARNITICARNCNMQQERQRRKTWSSWRGRVCPAHTPIRPLSAGKVHIGTLPRHAHHGCGRLHARLGECCLLLATAANLILEPTTQQSGAHTR